MRRLVLLLAAGLALCAAAASAAPGGDNEGTADAADMTRRLDSFLEQAGDSGLLIRRQATDLPEPAVVMAKPDRRTCPSADPYDFSGVSQVDTYTDLATALQGAAPADRARAFLAMGLRAEARAEIRNLPDETGEAMDVLLNILDHADPGADADYLAHLSACHSATGLWAALALARQGDQGAAPAFERELNTFRHLPLRLRVLFAREMIPALTAMQETLLAQKILSEFTAQERHDHRGLQFSEAVVAAAIGAPGSDAALQDFLRYPQFEQATLDILIRSGHRLDRVRHQMLLGSADSFDLGTQPTRLSYVVDAYAATSDYGDLIALANKAGPQAATVYPGLYDRFVDALVADLSGQDQRRQLAALDALIAGDVLLREGADRDALRAQGGAVARALGLPALAQALAGPARPAAPVAPEDGAAHTGLAAARDAWAAQDGARLSRLLADMAMTTPGLLQLAEQDAVSERWLFPVARYQDAIAASDGEQRARWRRLAALRRPVSAATRLRLFDVDAGLEASAAQLATLRQDIAP